MCFNLHPPCSSLRSASVTEGQGTPKLPRVRRRKDHGAWFSLQSLSQHESTARFFAYISLAMIMRTSRSSGSLPPVLCGSSRRKARPAHFFVLWGSPVCSWITDCRMTIQQATTCRICSFTLVASQVFTYSAEKWHFGPTLPRARLCSLRYSPYMQNRSPGFPLALIYSQPRQASGPWFPIGSSGGAADQRTISERCSCSF